MTSEDRAQGNIFKDAVISKRNWVNCVAQMPDHAMHLAGVPARKYYWDGKTFVDTIVDVSNYYDLDTFAMISDVYNYEVEALGAKMIYSDDAMPTVDFRDPLIKTPEDLYKLKTPDFHKDKRLPYAMEIMRYVQKYGVHQGFFCGTFSFAVALRTFTALIKDMRKNPKFAHELFTFIVDDVLVPYMKVQKQELGLSLSIAGDAWAGVPMVSMKDMDEWIVPYNRRLIEKCKEFGMEARTITGEYVEEHLDKFNVEFLHKSFEIEMASQNALSIVMNMGRWHEYPLEPVVQFLDKYKRQGIRVAVMAGIHAQVLRNGPIEAIVANVKRHVDAFAKDHDLVFFLANIPVDTPPEHVHTAVQAIHTLGAKPIAADLNKIKFAPTKRETFIEWKRAKPIK